MKEDDKLCHTGIQSDKNNSVKDTKGIEETETLEEIIDGFIDSNPIIYERLSKL